MSISQVDYIYIYIYIYYIYIYTYIKWFGVQLVYSVEVMEMMIDKSRDSLIITWKCII